jgi:hypothetical protein
MPNKPEMMNQNLLKAVVELVEASFERDFVERGPDDGAREERVFAAAPAVLDEILADSELASLHDWARKLEKRRGLS